jgi:hypothetical protein
MRGIIADTTPLFAAIDPSDQYHSRTRFELERIETENLSILFLYQFI